MRELGETSQRFTNVYVKNFGDELDKEKLDTLFSKFGPILSSTIMTDSEGKSKGFGFVSFENSEDAEQAVNEMNELELKNTDFKLTVCRAQKKSERQAELKRKYEQQKVERMQRYQGVNLYVKNLDDNVDDEMLRQNFESYGKITSAKVFIYLFFNIFLFICRLCAMKLIVQKDLDLFALKSLMMLQKLL